MGVRSYVKNTFKANTDAKNWAAWDSIRSNARTVKNIVSDINGSGRDPSGVPQKETFDEAVKRFGLTEAELQVRMKNHYRVAVICAILGLFSLVWVIPLFIKALYLSTIVALALSMLMFAYAFSEHFLYFRMKERRLDCTVDEWASSFFKKRARS